MGCCRGNWTCGCGKATADTPQTMLSARGAAKDRTYRETPRCWTTKVLKLQQEVQVVPIPASLLRTEERAIKGNIKKYHKKITRGHVSVHSSPVLAFFQTLLPWAQVDQTGRAYVGTRWLNEQQTTLDDYKIFKLSWYASERKYFFAVREADEQNGERQTRPGVSPFPRSSTPSADTRRAQVVSEIAAACNDATAALFPVPSTSFLSTRSRKIHHQSQTTNRDRKLDEDEDDVLLSGYLLYNYPSRRDLVSALHVELHAQDTRRLSPATPVSSPGGRRRISSEHEVLYSSAAKLVLYANDYASEASGGRARARGPPDSGNYKEATAGGTSNSTTSSSTEESESRTADRQLMLKTIYLTADTGFYEKTGIGCTVFVVDGLHEFAARTVGEKKLWLRVLANLKIKVTNRAPSPTRTELEWFRNSIWEYVILNNLVGLRIKHRSQELPRTSSFVAPGTSTSSFVAAADLAQEDGEPLTQGCAKVLRASNQLEAVALKLQQAGPSRFSRRYCPSVFSVVDYAFASDRDIAAAEQLGKKAKPTNAQGAQPADVVGGAVPSSPAPRKVRLLLVRHGQSEFNAGIRNPCNWLRPSFFRNKEVLKFKKLKNGISDPSLIRTRTSGISIRCKP
eukprot:g8632.t1